MKKIALEEHFSGPGFEKYLTAVEGLFDPELIHSIEKLLPDFAEKRLQMMDACGIEIAVLSQTAPGVQQERDTAKAIEAAAACNKFLFSQIEKNPHRYRGFACLALQDPHTAARQLELCVREYGFVGALVNSNTNGEYLDDPKFWPFWQKLEELEVPLYLHPGNPSDRPQMYEGRPELDGATWSWNCETATHALRLIFGGIFEKFPETKVILGHMGETLPFYLWRLDSRTLTTTKGRAMKKLPSEVFREHFLITTSGVCAQAPLNCSLTELGDDGVMFATDYPYEDAMVAAAFIEKATLSHEQREKICYKTAQRVFKLRLD